MVYASHILAAIAISFNPPPEWVVVEQIASVINDLTVTFETDTKVDLNLKSDFVDDTTSGVFKYHHDGVYYIELVIPKPEGVRRRRASCRAGGEPAKCQTLPEDPRVEEPHQLLDSMFSECKSSNFPTRFFPWSILVFGEKTWPEEIKYLGQEKIGAFDCQVFQRNFCGDETKIFISPEKSGQILRLEQCEDGKPFLVLRDVELREITDSKGKKVWFPIQGYQDNYWLGQRGITNKPVSVTQFRFLPGTLKLNTGAPSKDFEVQFDPKIKVRGVKPPVKLNTRDPITRTKASEKAVDDAVKDSDLDAAEAKDKAPQAVDTGIGTLWTALICLAVGCAVGAVFVSRRK